MSDLGSVLQAAEAHRYAGRWSAAVEVIDSERLSLRARGPASEARALIARARSLIDAGTFANGTFFTEAEDTLSEANRLPVQDRGVTGALRDQRGWLLHNRWLTERGPEPPELLACFEEALAVRRRLNDQRGCAESLMRVGLVWHLIRNERDRAMKIFATARRIADAAADRMTQSYVARHIGFVHMERGHLDQAELELRTSLALRERIGFVPGIAVALGSLGALLATRPSRRSEAERLFEAAVATGESIGAHACVEWMRAERAELWGDLTER